MTRARIRRGDVHCSVSTKHMRTALGALTKTCCRGSRTAIPAWPAAKQHTPLRERLEQLQWLAVRTQSGSFFACVVPGWRAEPRFLRVARRSKPDSYAHSV